MEELPEFKRESADGFPWVGLVVIALLILVGLGLVGFAVYAGQRETETRAIEGTVSVVLSFTSTSTQTRVPTDTPTVTLTPTVTETPTITQTPTTAPTLTRTPTATKTKKPTARPVQATDTPVPPPPTATSAPVSKHGITGQITLCNPEKQSFAATLERICFRELIVNNTSAPVSYGVLGVQATNLSGGPDKFQTSWRGDLSVPANGTGPTGGGWEDGMYIDTPGTYRLTLSICYSDVDTCLGSNGEWETLTSGVNVNVVNWTP
nr:hypothetical protein [Chloroflexota bacterium]